MRLMIDTNIFLDVLTQREPFYKSSQSALYLCECGQVQGFLSASSVTDIFYLVRRQLHSERFRRTYLALCQGGF